MMRSSQCELLPSLGARRLSSVYFSHFNRLLWNASAKWSDSFFFFFFFYCPSIYYLKTKMNPKQFRVTWYLYKQWEASSAIDCGYEPRSGQTKECKIGICCFSTKNASLRRKSKDWLARNQNNVGMKWAISIEDLP
jgi:hypothetical protein